jgi:hypothetical protein
MKTRMTTLTFSLCVALTLTALASTASAQDPAGTQAAAPVALNRLLVAHDIEDREPVRFEEPFTVGQAPVFVFVDVANPSGPEGELTLQWTHESGQVFAQTLSYGQSRRWRTWASRRMGERWSGAWRVEVFASDGRSLGAIDFEVAPAPDIERGLLGTYSEPRPLDC